MDDNGRYTIAAAFGAILSALRAVTGTWQRRAVIVFSGYGFAYWVGPVLIEQLHLATTHEILGLGFACGYLGDMVLSLSSQWAEKLIRDRITALMK